MRYLASFAAVVMLAASSPLLAQQVDTSGQRLDLAGDAPPACVIGSPRVANAVNASFATDSQTTGTIGIGQFVDQQTGQTLASSIDLSFPVICNASHSVTLRSDNGGMLRAGATTGGTTSVQGFSDFVTYQLQLDWQGQQIDLASNLGGGEIDAGQPGKGDLSLHVATPEGNGPLVAGQYDDAIVIEFSTSI